MYQLERSYIQMSRAILFWHRPVPLAVLLRERWNLLIVADEFRYQNYKLKPEKFVLKIM